MLTNSKDTDNKVLRLSRGHIALVGIAYLLTFAVFFLGIRHGVGQYWDWSFPYFRDQMDTLFTNKDSSWTNANMGSPLGYSSDYFIRFLISLFGFASPELVRYATLAIVFALGSLGAYLLCRRHTTGRLSFLIGLAAFINPAIFYKYTAGHFNYMVSLTLFIYLLYFLFYKFQKNFRSAVVVGLFLGLIGFQIQFFIITSIFLFVYFLFNRDKLAWKYITGILLIALLINLVWLSNFIVGASSATETGAAAAKVSFKSLSGSDFLSIFTFSFSKATLLTRFYAFYELLWEAGLFIFMLWMLTREKYKQSYDLILLVFLSLMIFMATGLYQGLNLGPLTLLYPMLREVGHFAPIIALVTLLLIARLIHGSRWRWALTLVLAVSLFIVGVKFQYFSQGYSFASVRSQFQPFKSVADNDDSSYRILAYPFFDQYSFNSFPKDPAGTLPLKNTGHDSFSAFSHQDYISNSVAPYKFKDSLQYKLLQSHNIDILRPYNVKYIFDLSSVYESNYERYVPPTTYDNNLKLIKNDKHFLDKLLAANPGKLRKINDHVLEIKNAASRISTNDNIHSLDNERQAEQLNIFSRQALNEAFDYTTNEPALEPYTTKSTDLYADSASVTANRDNTYTQIIKNPAKNASKLFVSNDRSEVFYEVRGAQLTIYEQPTSQLSLNGQPVYVPITGRTVIAAMPVQPKQRYFISFKGAVVEAKAGTTSRLGVGKAGDKIAVYEGNGQNIISNGSFEQDLWQKQVRDCNQYDSEAKIGMRRTTETASEGRSALELSAVHHTACTYTTVDVDANSSYLLSFDYQSPNAPTANFFMSYANKNSGFARSSQAIMNKGWNTYSNLVTTSDKRGAAQLYFYAKEGSGQQTVNRYDNVSLIKLTEKQTSSIPSVATSYQEINLPRTTEQRFVVSTDEQYKNSILNPSFEEGPWQAKVSDCRNYDSNAKLDMKINTTDATEGHNSLELEALRHDACVHTIANVTPDSDYQLSFDYKGQKGKYYGYAASFDDRSKTTQREQFTIDKAGWNRATFRIHVPTSAATLTLYLYSFEAGDQSKNTILYDNVNLSELPTFTDKFYVVRRPAQQVKKPQKITFDSEGTTHKSVQIKGAIAPFFVVLSETYHPKWQLELNNSAVSGLNRWNPHAKGNTIKDHFKVDSYSNGWLIDPAKLCEKDGKLQNGCTKNPDGSYDIKLLAEFTPQRWFVVAAIISWTTLLGSILYLVLGRDKTIPTYQWPAFMRRKK